MKSVYMQTSSYYHNIMRKYLFIICTIISAFNLYGQVKKPVRPYEKIQLEGLNPNWYETFYDSTMIDDRLDGYSHFRPASDFVPLIHGDKIFHAFSINTKDGIVGGYIECRNMKNGKMIWRDRFGLIDSGHVEIPRLMYIEEEKLIVIGQIKRSSGSSGLLNMIVSNRTYNALDGTLLSSKHGSFDDSTLLSTQDDISYATHTYFYKEKEHIRYIQPNSTLELGKVMIKSYLLDKDGRALRNDSLLVNQLYVNIAKISDDTLLLVEFDTASIWFRFVSPELKTYYSLESKYTFDHLMVLIKLMDISVHDRKVLFFNQRNNPFPDINYEIYVFNLDGSIYDTYDLKNKYTTDFYPIDWASKKGLLMGFNFIKSTSRSKRSSIDIKKFENETEFSVVKSCESIDSMRYATVFQIVPLGNGKYLSYFNEGALYVDTFNFITSDYNAFALSCMLLDEKDLGITSSTNEPTSNAIDGLEFFPNPVTESLTIRFATPYSGSISISDISGRTVMVRDVTDLSEEVNIDMSYLASGMYIVRLPKHVSGRSYKVVKM